MRLALVSDLHANPLALDAVLLDAQKAGFDQLVCLGDVATLGPLPHQVLARLEQLGCVCLKGNHDEFMQNPSLVKEYSPMKVLQDSVEATRACLTQAELAFIDTFVPTVLLGEVFCYHGTPRSNTEDLLVSTPDAEVDAMLLGKKAQVYVGGHTHLQMLRQHKGALVVNVGSVGAPFREHAQRGPPFILPHAEYALVELARGNARVELRRVGLDKAALKAQAEGWDNPLAASLLALYC